MSPDVVVVGLGVMGAATARALAQRGQRVVGIERFGIGHDQGSSHGDTRIIRLGYFEHPSYVPLLRCAYRRWRELERESGHQLLRITGIAEIGPLDSEIIKGTLRASEEHNLPHRVLNAAQAMQQFPAFRLPPDYVAVLQPDGGYLFAERAMHAFARLAESSGAIFRTGETVVDIAPRSDGVTVKTDAGTIDAGAVVVTPGAWFDSLLRGFLPKLREPLKVQGQVLAWFEPIDHSLFTPAKFPVFIIASEYGNHYGIPPHDIFPYQGLLKIAKHDYEGPHISPDGYNRTVTVEDEDAIRIALRKYLPAANGPLVAAKTCLYTTTADKNFLIDQVPGYPQMVFASACSGHGFKFAPVIGEMLADLILTNKKVLQFGLARLLAE
ncbi:MAG: N-methyl-L-tryptophan oxidase [Xanthobacteraceae bacterium]